MDFNEIVRKSGVSGGGGAGFPTYAKLTSNAEYILLNAAECEPLLRVDLEIIRNFTDEILKGFEKAGRNINAKKAVIGIKSKHSEAIEILDKRIKALGFHDFIEIMLLKDVFPMGDEQVLVYELTKRIVPEASIPLKVGCVVINVETALNIYNALLGRNVTHSFLTITGDLEKPMTLKVPIGMALKDLLEQCQINFDGMSIIEGGPMMGFLVEPNDSYVTKRTKGYILLKKDHFLIHKKSVTLENARKASKTACEQCRMCTDLCPRYLLGHNIQPHKIMRALAYNLQDLSQLESAFLCCECNCCQLYACPTGIYPRSINSLYKKILKEKNINFSANNEALKVRETRDFRLIPSKRLILKLGLKAFDKDAPILDIKLLPKILKISMNQSNGTKPISIVKCGQNVEKGEEIASIDDDKLGLSIHSPVDGKILEIDDEYIKIEVNSHE